MSIFGKNYKNGKHKDGRISGILANYSNKTTNESESSKVYENIFTGYPNFNKWKHDFNLLCEQYPEHKCSLILFEFENFETIKRYTNYEIGNYTSKKLLSLIEQYFCTGNVYSVSQKKFLVMLQDVTLVEACRLANKFLYSTKKPIYIEEIPVAVVLKGGIDCLKLNDINKHNIYNNLEKALDQSQRFKRDITIFNQQIAEERQEYYNTIVSIYRALQNNSFYLVYQPKISLEEDKVQGVEALLRWNNNTYGNIPISQVIKIAEEVDFINYITKWVIQNAIKQLKAWQEQGKSISIAINISARDLNDYSLVKFVTDSILFYEINPSLLEFELTERSIIENEEKVFRILNEFKDLGIKVSLDDYGTGYNSLMYLVKSLFKFDYVKIDKIFIDEITNENTQILIRGIVNAAHGLGIRIIAEGVETEEQLNILKNMECDIIQGYYYSKPLQPEELETFIESRKVAV